jgi:hypothetical protein
MEKVMGLLKQEKGNCTMGGHPAARILSVITELMGLRSVGFIG